jgi:hypothetical protein
MQTKFLDAVISAMEANMLNYVLWNYNPHNSHHFGDRWNGEDFSIFSSNNRKEVTTSDFPVTPADSNSANSEDEILSNSSSCALSSSPFDISDISMESTNDEPHVGGRALDAIIRPHACAIAGVPISTSFRVETKKFELIFATKSESIKKTEQECTSEIFVPKFHYSSWNDFHVEVSDGVWRYDPESEMIFWVFDPTVEQTVKPSTKSWFGFPEIEPQLPDELKHFHYLRITEKKAKRNSWWKSV